MPEVGLAIQVRDFEASLTWILAYTVCVGCEMSSCLLPEPDGAEWQRLCMLLPQCELAGQMDRRAETTLARRALDSGRAYRHREVRHLEAGG